MDLQTRVSILQFFLGVGLLGFAYAHMYRRTRTDQYREDLFTLRDELFDYMWQNNIPFDLPAYRLMRQALNGAIRTADSLSVWSFFWVAVALRRNPDKADRLTAALDALADQAVRKHLWGVLKRFAHRFLSFLFAEGAMGLVVSLASRLATVRDWVQPRLRLRAEQWNEPLVTFGSDENPALRMSGERRPRFRFRHI